MRVILFDIDGTLLLTDRAGQRAMNELATGSAEDNGMASEIAFAGRTDRAIIMEYFQRLGMEANEENFRAFCRRFLHRLPQQLQARRGYVLPGVGQLLDRLSSMPGVAVGLLTGNLRDAARLKLRHYCLDHYFYLAGEPMGGFGDEHLDRDDVARTAWRDVRQRINVPIEPCDVCIIGDTPLDVKCARAISVRVLAVATGGYTQDELRQTQADWVVPDLNAIDDWWQQFIQEPDPC